MELLNSTLYNIAQKRNGNVRFPVIEKKEFLETHIDILELDVRSSNVLKRNGICNIQSVLNNLHTIPNLKGCGVKTVNRIIYKICEYYYSTLSETEKQAYLNKIEILNEND